MAALSATLVERTPSGVAVDRPALHLELSPEVEGGPKWSCGSCSQAVRAPSNRNSLVKRLARYDTLFEGVINGATNHSAGYNVRFKLFF